MVGLGKDEHINIPEMRLVQKALITLQERTFGQDQSLMTDNSFVVLYANKLGDCVEISLPFDIRSLTGQKCT